jgi:hypothetical protein
MEFAAPVSDGTSINFNIDPGGCCLIGPANMTIQYSYIHGGGVGGIMANGSNQLIEHNYIQNTGGKEHSQMIDASSAQNLTIRYNLLENLICNSSCGTTYIEPQANGTNAIPNGIYVYGNIFRSSPGQSNDGANNPEIFSSTSGQQVLNVFIFNNTIYDLANSPTAPKTMKDTGVRGDNPGSTVTVQNNLWLNNAYPPGFQSVQVQDHNVLNTLSAADVALLIPNAETGDFHLKANTTAGAPLTNITIPGIGTNPATTTTFERDPDGKVRTTWSIGAYEYDPTYSPPVAQNNINNQTLLAASLLSSKNIPWVWVIIILLILVVIIYLVVNRKKEGK